MCNKLCKPQKVVLDGKEIVIRKPKMSDVKSLTKFINSLVEEDAPILLNKRYTEKRERSWLKEQMKLIKENEQHLLLADYKGEIIGNMGVHRGKWREYHTASVGISVKKNYRGIGLGKLLMKKSIEIAKKDPKIKVLTLSVYPINKIAMNMYKKLGFKVIAKLPKRHLYKRKYVDEFVMDYPLNKI